MFYWANVPSGKCLSDIISHSLPTLMGTYYTFLFRKQFEKIWFIFNCTFISIQLKFPIRCNKDVRIDP